MNDNYYIITTALWQIIQNEHSLANIEQQLVSKQKVNHQIFESFCSIIQKIINMINFVLLQNIVIFCYYINFYQTYQVILEKVFSFLDNPDVECLDLTNIFLQEYDFGEHKFIINIASIPKNMSVLIDAEFFFFIHFKNLFYSCIENTVQNESE